MVITSYRRVHVSAYTCLVLAACEALLLQKRKRFCRITVGKQLWLFLSTYDVALFVQQNHSLELTLYCEQKAIDA